MLNKEDQIETIDRMINRYKLRIEILELIKENVIENKGIWGS